jgi:hypothetical protein
MIIRIILILSLIFLASCGQKMVNEKPPLQLPLESLPNVYVQYDSRTNIFRIGNELIERQILVNKEKNMVYTVAFINKLSGRNYIKSLGEEFSFRANETKISGVTGDLKFIDYTTPGYGGVETLELNFQLIQQNTGILNIKLFYEAFSNMPVIRKWVEIENPGGSSIKIDSIQMESLNMVPGSGYDVEVYDKPDSSKNIAQSLSPIVFNTNLIEGFRVANETPGLLKHTVIDPVGGSISIGMKPHFQNYAPEIQLAPKERFACPAIFILLFKGEAYQSYTILEKFVFEYLLTKPPAYSVWYENMGDELIESDLSGRLQLAVKSGANTFCLDGDWMDKRGNWIVKENVNFKDLKNKAGELGMKIGLSMDLAIVDPGSQVLADHPAWVVKSKDGSDYVPVDGMGSKMMCLASEYAMYIAYEVDALVKELNLDYIRFTGPIIPEGQPGGCFSQEHIHRSNSESLWYIYEGFFAICKYLHSKHPDLIIQLSPKSYNPEGGIDYQLLKYADMEWPF